MNFSPEPVAAGASMRAVVGSAWALLVGLGLLMLGDGLQMTLLALRASLEGFPTAVTGVLMSSFYVGFLGGSVLAPGIVRRVGHVRTFAALASLASACILVHAVFVGPLAWAALRLASGFCFAGIYVVAESWLNDAASNETRGQLLSVYMVITYVGFGLGQLLLNAADPLGYELFILTSVLISVALVPLLLSASPAPHSAGVEPMSLRALYRVSPLGFLGAVATGMAGGALFGMGPVYAQAIGLSVAQVSLLMSAPVVGCVCLQWPIGHLSDRFDRRRVLTAVTWLAALAAAAATVAARDFLELLVVIALLGGLSLPLYALSVAHANDFLERRQMVAASAGLVLASGIGAVAGPAAASLAMDALGPSGFLWFVAAIHAALGVFAFYRMARRPARPLEDQGPFAPATVHGSWAGEWLEEDEELEREGENPEREASRARE